jgi:hypothetical protein
MRQIRSNQPPCSSSQPTNPAASSSASISRHVARARPGKRGDLVVNPPRRREPHAGERRDIGWARSIAVVKSLLALALRNCVATCTEGGRLILLLGDGNGSLLLLGEKDLELRWWTTASIRLSRGRGHLPPTTTLPTSPPFLAFLLFFLYIYI